MRRLAVVILFAVGCSGSESGPASASSCAVDGECDDSIACTNDRCTVTVNGIRECVNTPDDSGCPNGSICMVTSLLGPGCQNPLKLLCVGKSEDSSCEPSDACATSPGRCTGGMCEYTRRQCPDRPCLVVEGCDSSTGTCRYVMAGANARCDIDGQRCTDDVCVGGVCTAGPDTCECSSDRPCIQPANLCLGRAECLDGQCVSTPVDCSQSDTDCAHSYCLPQTGACRTVPVNEEGPCSDGSACGVDGTCDQGVCVTVPRKCPERQCMTVACVEPDGCVYEPADLPCDDGDACNGPDKCVNGACTPSGPAVDCEDFDPCTADSCDPESGACRHAIVPGCCGNGMIEADEQCDGPGRSGSGCIGCRFAKVNLDNQGASPAFAWSSAVGSGLVLWEMVDAADGHAVAACPVTGSGSFENPVPLPAGTVSGRTMSPAVAAVPDGFVAGALTAKGPEFWLLDGAGRPTIRSTVRNQTGSIPASTGLAIGWSPFRTVAAWADVSKDGSPRIMYADMAPGRSQLLVSGASELYSAGSGDTLLPGDVCATDSGVFITFSVVTAVSGNAGGSWAIHKVAFFGAGEPVPLVFDLASYSWDIAFPAVCAGSPDGLPLFVYMVPDQSGHAGLVIQSSLLDTDIGPGTPEDILVSDGTEKIAFPFVSDLASVPGGFIYLFPMVSGGMVSPVSIRPTVLNLSSSGQPAGPPEELSGPEQNFVSGLTTAAAGGVTGAFWVESPVVGAPGTSGTVAGRLYGSFDAGTD